MPLRFLTINIFNIWIFEVIAMPKAVQHQTIMRREIWPDDERSAKQPHDQKSQSDFARNLKQELKHAFEKVPIELVSEHSIGVPTVGDKASETSSGQFLVQKEANLWQGKRNKNECKLPDNARWCFARPRGIASFLMAVYKENDIVSNSICKVGHWEMETFSGFGDPGRALDVGGHVGYYTLALAQAGWNVTTFEPLQRNVELLQASLCVNPHLARRVNVNAFGLGKGHERCAMVSNDNNIGFGQARCGEDPLRLKQGDSKRGDSQLHRLDDVLAEQAVDKIDFIKIDVEGSECQVLEGAPNLMSRYKPKLIQSEVLADTKVCDPKQYLALFRQASYHVKKRDRKSVV